MPQLLANDLFLLMINLSRANQGDQAISLFTEAMNSRLPGLIFEHHPSSGQGESVFNIPSAITGHGRIEVKGDLGALSPESRALVGNSINLLGLVLDNLWQKTLLDNQKQHLQVMVEERTRELEQIFNMSLDLICIADLESASFIKVNQAFFDILGYSEKELLSKSFFSFIHPDDVEATREMMLANLKLGKKVINFTNRYQRKDGRYIWLNWVSHPKPAEGITFAIARDVSEDITAREIRHKLELQLRQIEKMDALGALASGIAHDFNNILTAIIGYSELALEDVEDGTINIRMLEQIKKAGTSARELVNQILTFSRKMEPDLVPLDLNRIISQTHSLLERTIPKMIQIERRLADDLRSINGDFNQLAQVIMNLATNSRDAMPHGGRLIIETANVYLDQEYADQHMLERPGEYIKLEVTDTGNGMDQETIQYIFDPFYTSKAAGQGTGLGLSTVYGIVKSHGGHISCYSEPGTGTSFKVFLPALLSDRQGDALERADLSEISGGNETILLVDDEEAIRDLGQRLLRRAGYRVLLAPDGEEALKIYRENIAAIGLIILDINMPGMGGQKCFAQIMRLNPAAKVIIASGYSERSLINSQTLGEAPDFLPKPFSRRELLGSVRRLLDS